MLAPPARNRSPRALLSPDDIRQALRWRLESVGSIAVDLIADALRPHADTLRDDHPEVAAVLADIADTSHDKREAWSLACAVVAHDADRRRAVNVFWAAGSEVVKAMNQSARGKRRRTVVRDELDALIVQVLHEHPTMRPSQVFNELRSLACAGDPLCVEWVHQFDAIRVELESGCIHLSLSDLRTRLRRLKKVPGN